MKESIVNFFGEYASIIVMFHVASAVLWVGSMMFLSLVISVVTSGETTTYRVEQSLEILKKYINSAKYAVGILIATGGIMAIGLGFRQGDPDLYMIVHFKEGIWTIMSILFYLLYRKVKNYSMYDEENFKAFISYIKKILYVSVLFGVVAIYFGIKLRGF
jgi:uncharacterized membrane protein